ncbi:MAG: hypothetical protein KBD01_00985 [Acidobacteria bacterium]|nr:hypothetical protein [Acidobacteriota bacterium]
MGLWTARQIWKSLDRERRVRSALALWDDERLSRADRLAALGPWLTARGIRASFLEQLPRPRRAELIADAGLPEDTAQQLLMSYHLVHQRPLLGAFLEALGIGHEDGVIAEGADIKPPGEQAVGQALEKIRAEYAADDVELYLRTLTMADAETWAAVAGFAGDPA